MQLLDKKDQVQTSEKKVQLTKYMGMSDLGRLPEQPFRE